MPISTQFRLNRWVALLGVTAISLYLSWKIIEPFIEVLILGIAFVMIFNPVHQKILRWVKRDYLAAGLSTLFAFLVVAIPFAFVSHTILRELPGAIDAVQRGLTDVQGRLKAATHEDGAVAALNDLVDLENLLSPEKLKAVLSNGQNVLVSGAFKFVKGAVSFLVSLVFLIFVLFFLFRDGGRLGDRVIEFLPMPRAQAEGLARRTYEVLGACVYGVLMVASVQGALGGITFWLLGLPSPATWAVVMTILCTLPIVGAWLVWLPAAIGLAMDEQYGKAIILALVGQVIISSIDGFLRPILVGQRAKLHELAIFFSVLGGLKYFGILGILLGPIIFALTSSLLSVLLKVAPGGPGDDVKPDRLETNPSATASKSPSPER